MKKTYQICLLAILGYIFISGCKSKQEEWISLFNGKDLTGWTPKISGYALNENFNNTFTVDSGILKVDYSKYQKFNGEFGHIFYKTPYSHYKIRLEYRFVGKQTEGGADWANRNSGIMIHCQAPETMGKGQSFPVSIEVQLLGGLGEGERTTGNVCTPGTLIDYEGKPYLEHCLSSKSKTYNGDNWVKSEVVVLGDSIIHHIIEGDTVLTYTKTRIGGGYMPKLSGNKETDLADSLEYVKNEGKPLSSGYISLQAESGPVEFRKIELLDLGNEAEKP
ncbi:MAG: DUF1080 domain-containing protein [Bacteroidales bacterium]